MNNHSAVNARTTSCATAILLLLVGCRGESGSLPNTDTLEPAVAPAVSSASDTSARSPGAQTYLFRASGNEPGWLLTASDSLLTLRWDYDERRVDLLSPQIEQTAGGKRITASGEPPQDTVRVVVEIRETRCADGMSGQQFPASVTVQVNGRTLRGCGGNPVELLTNGTWEVTVLNAKPLVESSRLTMEFTPDGKLTGTAGCNRYMTTFTLSPESMHIDAPAATRMACGGAKDQQEREFLAALGSAQQYLLDEQGILTVSSANGTSVLARRSTTSR